MAKSLYPAKILVARQETGDLVAYESAREAANLNDMQPTKVGIYRLVGISIVQSKATLEDFQPINEGAK